MQNPIVNGVVALLMVAVLLAGCAGSVAHDTPEEAAEVVYQSLQAGDVQLLKPLLPQLDDLRENYDKTLEQDGSESLEPWDEAKVTAAVVEIDQKLTSLWEEVRDAGAKVGIDWATVVKKETVLKRNEYVARFLSNVADVDLLIESDGEAYVLAVTLIEYERGWLLAKLSLGKTTIE